MSDHLAAPRAQPLPRTGAGPRVLVYSHDTFGLGHLRRCRAIANRLVENTPTASIIIVSGSPIIGRFDFANGVDFVRVPGVVKLPDGGYTTLSLRLSLEDAIAMRKAIILGTCQALAPDMIIVDKEPTGFHGELMPTLDYLKGRGTRIVLGVRDVLDSPGVLVPEWERKGSVDALITYYDDIWVYGLQEIYEPLAGLPLPPEVVRRIAYTGYLKRELPQRHSLNGYPKLTQGPFVLVTTGGGGDGIELIDWVLAAYEADPAIPIPALIVFGPFMPPDHRAGFLDRIAKHPSLEAITFDAGLEYLMSLSAGVVSMGGYNTFCEILSLDKRAVIIPRRSPRLEQSIRAERASHFGLVRHLDGAHIEPGASRDPMIMARAIRALPNQPLPSKAFLPHLLDGLPRIDALAAQRLCRVETQTEHRLDNLDAAE
jgi:predicted glycosyltransferase